MKVLNFYYSETGNTEKIAKTISTTLSEMGYDVQTVKAERGLAIDFLKYDFIFAGSGVYQWLPGKPMLDMLRSHRHTYAQSGKIMPCAPRLEKKKTVIYCTYAGVHTGIHEAMPAVKFCGQLFDHLGFTIIDEWYFIGDFKTPGLKKFNTTGRMGNITGRPDKNDLKQVAEMVKAVMKV